jgi:hypothetical protein
MQKTILYLAILAILGFGVWFFLFSERKAGDASFTVIDTASIGKIFLAPNSSTQTITAERKPGGWIVNKEYPVLQSTLNQLLITIHNQRALFPVQDNQRDAVVRSLIASGVKVEIYDLEGRKMRSFFVGNEIGRFSGTVMLEEGSERPYVVQIPGFEGYLTTRYTANLAIWRDRLVFNYRPEDIAEVEVKFPLKPADNFTISNSGATPNVTLDPAIRPQQPLNQRRVRAYLSFFKMMYNEAYQSYPGLDTLIRDMPEFADVRVKDAAGKENSVRFFYAPVETRNGTVDVEGRTYSDERYYAIMNNGKDTATVQIPLFERLFRSGPEFFVADEKSRFNVPGNQQ